MVKETHSASDLSAVVKDNKIENTSSSEILSSNNQPDRNESSSSLRSQIGGSVSLLTDFIEDNIIVARIAGKTSVFLLTAYGLYKTPIFFRYKRVADIPPFMFTKRKTIYGRIVHLVEPDFAQRMRMNNLENPMPITCLVRHQSPMGRLLNKSAFEFLEKYSPTIGKYHNVEDAKDLIKVEIAGIQSPPFYFASSTAPDNSTKEGTNEWLQTLVDQKATLSCQLLSRRVVDAQEMQKLNVSNSETKHLQTLHPTLTDMRSTTMEDVELQQVAICKIGFRPPMTIFRKDLASSLVSFGRANVAPGMHIDIQARPTIDGSTSLEDMENDVKYIEKLSKLEYEAVKTKKGMWSIDSIRSSRPDLVEFAKDEETASWWKKLWNKFRDS